MQGIIKEPAMAVNYPRSVERLLRYIFFYLCGFFAVNSSAVLAATYYVKTTGNDSISCSNATNESTPRRTINAGKNCLTTPGDTLIVGDGTYVEGHIDIGVSGTSTAPITIRAQNKLKATLSSVSGTTCSPNISFSGSFLVIDGLRGQIDPSDPVCPTNSAYGAFVRMWEGSGRQGGVVRNCQVDPSSHRGVGIKVNQDNTLVENCTMHSSLEGFYGINQVFRNNYIDTPDAWGSFFTSKGGARNTQFYNNVIVMNSGWEGLSLGGNSSCCWLDSTTHYEGYNQVAFNNVVVVNGGNGNYAMGMTGCKDCALYNNVLINGKLFMQQGSQSCCSPLPWPSNSVVMNNIISCGGNAAVTSWSSGVETVIDYNNFYNCSGAPPQAHPIVGDPQFVDPQSDWHLNSGSPAIGSGVQVSFTGVAGQAIDVSKDKQGVTRTTPWSLGLYAGTTTTANNPPPIPPSGLRVQ